MYLLTWANGQTHDPEEPIDDPEDANHFLHEAPQSVQNLFDALQEEGARYWTSYPRKRFPQVLVCTSHSCAPVLSNIESLKSMVTGDCGIRILSMLGEIVFCRLEQVIFDHCFSKSTTNVR